MRIEASSWSFREIPFPAISSGLNGDEIEGTGNVYYSRELDAEGWLCPALLRYFEARPPEIYVQVKAKGART
jgi:hypothetical protein